MTEFSCTRFVKATRKPHRCDWCGEIIPAGSPAEHASGKFDGDFYSGHLHLECAVARNNADWIYEDGFEPQAQARGRTDDDRDAPPEFTAADYRLANVTP